MFEFVVVNGDADFDFPGDDEVNVVTQIAWLDDVLTFFERVRLESVQDVVQVLFIDLLEVGHLLHHSFYEFHQIVIVLPHSIPQLRLCLRKLLYQRLEVFTL